MLEKWRWKYFKPHEVLSPHGLAQFKKGNLLLQEYALDEYSKLREHVGVPFTVNFGIHKHRGYRSVEENKKVDGGAYSRHVQGIAFDTTPKGMSLTHFVDEALKFGVGGIGLYENFVHIDFRIKLGFITFWHNGKTEFIKYDSK